MAHDDEDDLFVEDFDFVDEDEGEVDDIDEKGADLEQAEPGNDESEAETPDQPKRKAPSRGGRRSPKPKAEPEVAHETEDGEAKEAAEEKEEAPVEEPKEPAVPTDHVVHIYEYGNFVRTINREFTSDDAEAFAVEYNRTSGAHSRQGVAAGRDDKPAEAV